VPDVLRILVDHINEEIDGDHHGQCVDFLRALGVENWADIQPLPSTDRYCNSFLERFCSGRSSQEALAALAGRETVAPKRNRIILDALSEHYNIRSGLNFLTLHEELELQHFVGLWSSITTGSLESESRCMLSACQEIRRHVEFWDVTLAQIAGTDAV